MRRQITELEAEAQQAKIDDEDHPDVRMPMSFKGYSGRHYNLKMATGDVEVACSQYGLFSSRTTLRHKVADSAEVRHKMAARARSLWAPPWLRQAPPAHRGLQPEYECRYMGIEDRSMAIASVPQLAEAQCTWRALSCRRCSGQMWMACRFTRAAF